MEKIDRLGWVAGICFKAYGLRVGIRTNRPEVMERIMGLLPPGWKPLSSSLVQGLYSLRAGGNGLSKGKVRHFNLLYSGMAQIARSNNLEDVFGSLEISLRHYVAEYAPDRLFVHAGVVGWRGKAIVIPGQTFAGKSTLVAELVGAGATYYSDEYALLDSRGRVHPYPKPISIRKEGSAQQEEYSVESLGGRSGEKPLPVGLVVVARYQARAKWKPRTLSAGQGALELFAHTVPARRRPGVALTTLERAVSQARVLKGARGEAKEAARQLLQILA
jgi:hypothetical protein